VQQRSHPDRFGFIAHQSEKNACENRPKTFGQWFAEMNHAVGNQHDENGKQPEVFFQSMDHESTKEKFKPKELDDVKNFPDEVVGKVITQRKIKRIGRLKLRSERDDEDQRKNDQKHEEINSKISKELFTFQSIFSQSLLKQNFDRKNRDHQIKEGRSKRPKRIMIKQVMPTSESLPTKWQGAGIGKKIQTDQAKRT